MESRHRRTALALIAVAGAAWVVVAIVALTLDPTIDSNAALLGAVSLGLATGFTAAPLLWLVAFARHRRIAYRGDWTRAMRRGAWIGLLVGLFVVMRVSGSFQPQIGLFLLALALVAEITLSAGGPGRA